jgi:putative ABC transport system permease protein
MNVFHKVALEGLKKSRTRTMVTIVGVALSAAMFTAVGTIGVSLLDYMTRGAMQKYGDWQVSFSDADADFIQQQSGLEQVAKTAAVENIGYAPLEGSRNAEKPFLFLTAYSDDAFQMLPVTLLSGRLPQNSSEAIVSGKVAVEAGVKLAVGDTVTLSVGDRMAGGKMLGQNDPFDAQTETFAAQEQRTVTIVGICQRPRFEDSSAPGYTLITKADAADRAESLSLFVCLKNPYQLKSYLAGQAQGRAYSLNDDVLRFIGLSEDTFFTGILFAVGAIVAAIIMTGSVFLIYNSFNISLNERTQQFGILMSVGATGKQLRNSVLFEGLCIGAAGIPIGILLGLLGVQLIITLVARTFGAVLYCNVPLRLVFSLPVLLAAAAVSLVTILISAWLPARKAVRTPVMECIRQTGEIKVETKAVKTSAFAQRLYGLEGTLALKNFRRNKKRYRSIVLSLVLSVVLFISASAFVTNMKQFSGDHREGTTYDIALAAQDMPDSELIPLYGKLKAVSGVTAGSYQEVVRYQASVPAAQTTEDYRRIAGVSDAEQAACLPLQVQFLDDTTYGALVSQLGLPAESYTGANAKLIAVAKAEEDGKYYDLFSAAEENLTLAPQTADGTFAAQGEEVCITFADTVLPDVLPSLEAAKPTCVYFQVIAPWSLRDALIPEGTAVEMKGMSFNTGSPSQSGEEMEAIIEGEGITTPYNLYNMNRLMDESRNYIFIADVFSYLFIFMISLIAIANVFNTISTNIKLRRRELAMLRSVGMAEHDFQKMMNFECAFYGMQALAIGLPLAVLCCWLIYKELFLGDVEGIRFELPWASIGVSIFSVLFIVFITMLYSVSKIKKENIIDAMRDDMT